MTFVGIPPELLNDITCLLPGYYVGLLWMTGDKTLQFKMSKRAGVTELDVQISARERCPKLVLSLRLLRRLSITTRAYPDNKLNEYDPSTMYGGDWRPRLIEDYPPMYDRHFDLSPLLSPGNLDPVLYWENLVDLSIDNWNGTWKGGKKDPDSPIWPQKAMSHQPRLCRRSFVLSGRLLPPSLTKLSGLVYLAAFQLPTTLVHLNLSLENPPQNVLWLQMLPKTIITCIIGVNSKEIGRRVHWCDWQCWPWQAKLREFQQLERFDVDLGRPPFEDILDVYSFLPQSVKDVSLGWYTGELDLAALVKLLPPNLTRSAELNSPRVGEQMTDEIALQLPRTLTELDAQVPLSCAQFLPSSLKRVSFGSDCLSSNPIGSYCDAHNGIPSGGVDLLHMTNLTSVTFQLLTPENALSLPPTVTELRARDFDTNTFLRGIAVLPSKLVRLEISTRAPVEVQAQESSPVIKCECVQTDPYPFHQMAEEHMTSGPDLNGADMFAVLPPTLTFLRLDLTQSIGLLHSSSLLLPKQLHELHLSPIYFIADETDAGSLAFWLNDLPAYLTVLSLHIIRNQPQCLLISNTTPLPMDWRQWKRGPRSGNHLQDFSICFVDSVPTREEVRCLFESLPRQLLKFRFGLPDDSPSVECLRRQREARYSENMNIRYWHHPNPIHRPPKDILYKSRTGTEYQLHAFDCSSSTTCRIDESDWALLPPSLTRLAIPILPTLSPSVRKIWPSKLIEVFECHGESCMPHPFFVDLDARQHSAVFSVSAWPSNITSLERI